jgi:hypothetical protein
VTGPGSWRRSARAAACALLAAIALDLLADTRCELASGDLRSPQVLELSQPPGAGDEPCAAYCVPDCFCCSRSTVAASAVLPPEPGAVAPFSDESIERWSEGVRAIVDHPPLLRG